MKHQISIFNLQENRKLKFDIDFQFSIYRFHGKLKLKFGCQFSYFNFCIRTRNIYFWFAVLRSGKSEKAWNKQRPEGNENQLQ